MKLLITNAFLPIFPLLSDLEGIITTRALTNSVMTNLKREFSGDRLFLQIADFHTTTTFAYISVAIFFIYGQWKFHEGSRSQSDKFKKMDAYIEKENILKNIVLIVLYTFIKDVQSAS